MFTANNIFVKYGDRVLLNQLDLVGKRSGSNWPCWAKWSR